MRAEWEKDRDITDLGRALVFGAICLGYFFLFRILCALAPGSVLPWLLCPPALLWPGVIRDPGSPASLTFAPGYAVVVFSPIALLRPLTGKDIVFLILVICAFQPILFFFFVLLWISTTGGLH